MHGKLTYQMSSGGYPAERVDAVIEKVGFDQLVEFEID